MLNSFKVLLVGLLSIFLVLLLCVIIGGGVWFSAHFFNIETKLGDISSWVQAIGSIGAIWGAFFLGNKQLVRQAAQQLDRDRKKVGAYIAVVEHAVEQCRQVYCIEALEDSKGSIVAAWNDGFSEIFNSSLTSLRALPAHEFGDRDLVTAYAHIVGAMAKIATELTKQSSLDTPDEDDSDFLHVALDVSLGIIDMNWGSFETYLEFGGQV